MAALFAAHAAGEALRGQFPQFFASAKSRKALSKARSTLGLATLGCRGAIGQLNLSSAAERVCPRAADRDLSALKAIEAGCIGGNQRSLPRSKQPCGLADSEVEHGDFDGRPFFVVS
jgi:hypothetical protein